MATEVGKIEVLPIKRAHLAILTYSTSVAVLNAPLGGVQGCGGGGRGLCQRAPSTLTPTRPPSATLDTETLLRHKYSEVRGCAGSQAGVPPVQANSPHHTGRDLWFPPPPLSPDFPMSFQTSERSGDSRVHRKGRLELNRRGFGGHQVQLSASQGRSTFSGNHNGEACSNRGGQRTDRVSRKMKSSISTKSHRQSCSHHSDLATCPVLLGLGFTPTSKTGALHQWPVNRVGPG